MLSVFTITFENQVNQIFQLKLIRNTCELRAKKNILTFVKVSLRKETLFMFYSIFHAMNPLSFTIY